jgi:hypothetical protein
MLKTESHIFFKIPDESTEIALHRAKILTVKENLYTAELEEEGLALEDGMDYFIYFELDRQFMRQAARLGSVIGTEPRIVVEFETIGDLESAENRQALRISSVGANLTSTFGSEKNCQVVDISPTGFAVYATKNYEIDSSVDATLHFEGEDFPGMVCIKAAIPRKSEIRYGVFCLDDQKSGGSLQNGLGKITMAIQRKQLARVSRDE